MTLVICGDGQVRAAYRRKGWGFTDPQQIAQCAKEGFLEKLRAQEGEGCHLWGSLAVNKVNIYINKLSHITDCAGKEVPLPLYHALRGCLY